MNLSLVIVIISDSYRSPNRQRDHDSLSLRIPNHAIVLELVPALYTPQKCDSWTFISDFMELEIWKIFCPSFQQLSRFKFFLYYSTTLDPSHWPLSRWRSLNTCACLFQYEINYSCLDRVNFLPLYVLNWGIFTISILLMYYC